MEGVGMAAEGGSSAELSPSWWEGAWGSDMAFQEGGDCISRG